MIYEVVNTDFLLAKFDVHCATNKCKGTVKYWYNLDFWCKKDFLRVLSMHVKAERD